MNTRRNRSATSKESLKARVEYWALKVRARPKSVRIQKMKRKWASCSTNKCLTFSESLLQESAGFQDFVIVHELIHLKIPNHGKLFKSLLSAYLPGWKRWHKLLKGDE
jgi:predicted metal-dependent hydrolase